MLCNFVPFKRLPPLKNDNTAQKMKFPLRIFSVNVTKSGPRQFINLLQFIKNQS